MPGPETRPEQPSEISIVNPFVGFLIMGDPDEGGDVRIARVQKDGTLRIWSIQAGLTIGGEERPLSSENTGELRTVPLLDDGTNLVHALAEAGRQLGVSLYGKTVTPAQGAVRINDNFQLFDEPYEHWLSVPPVEVGTVDAIVWDPGLAAADRVLVELDVYAFSAAAAVVTLYVDIAGGGTVSNAEYFMNAESIVSKDRIGFVRLINGNDDIRGLTSVANVANVHFRARQVKRL